MDRFRNTFFDGQRQDVTSDPNIVKNKGGKAKKNTISYDKIS